MKYHDTETDAKEGKLRFSVGWRVVVSGLHKP
jgi:hypothetical protein